MADYIPVVNDLFSGLEKSIGGVIVVIILAVIIFGLFLGKWTGK